MSFIQRQIGVAFTLGTGNFAGGGNTANYSDLRISARIDGPGGSLGTAQVAVWGMPLSDMNQLSLIGKIYAQASGRNRITITAGDAGGSGALPTVFEGIILASFPDLSAQPQACFHVTAQGCAAINIQKSDTHHFDAGADAVKAFQTLADAADPPLKLQSNGIALTLGSQQYLDKSIGTQIADLAHNLGVEYAIDNGTLYLGKSGQGYGSPVVIAEGDNMVDYPAFNQNTILVTSLFNPALRTMGKITVKSSITAAEGEWVINNVTHEIDAQIPKGRWFTRTMAYQASAGVVASNG